MRNRGGDYGPAPWERTWVVGHNQFPVLLSHHRKVEQECGVSLVGVDATRLLPSRMLIRSLVTKGFTLFAKGNALKTKAIAVARLLRAVEVEFMLKAS